MKKTLYVNDLYGLNKDEYIELYGWIYSVKAYKTEKFIIVEDSTGRINVRVTNANLKFKREQSVYIYGVTDIANSIIYIDAISARIIGENELDLYPPSRSTFDILGFKNNNHIEKNKHLYIRNKKYQTILKARSLVLDAVRAWFKSNNYFDVTAPILTPILLYENNTGIDVEINGAHSYLTQCVGFYLESAVHSLEKVYNIGPSFRAAESVSKRHLMEYWHIKSELAFCDFEDYFSEIESMIAYVVAFVEENGGNELAEELGVKLCIEGKKIPYKRIEYSNAIALLQHHGCKFEFGKSISGKAVGYLTNHLSEPFWIVHNPRTIEGFPYKINKEDSRLTETADLIASESAGEILGIADKITSYDELLSRIEEKGKNIEDYKWFLEIRKYGTIPHCGMGMGVERLIRWLFSLDHVKDAIPFPRRINHRIYP